MITTTIKGCARCGGDHRDVTFRPFALHPISLDECTPIQKFTHYTLCPHTGDPVLLVWSLTKPDQTRGTA